MQSNTQQQNKIETRSCSCR